MGENTSSLSGVRDTLQKDTWVRLRGKLGLVRIVDKSGGSKHPERNIRYKLGGRLELLETSRGVWRWRIRDEP